MKDPEDNRWLAVLDEEWRLNGRLALHLPCKSAAPVRPAEPPAAPSIPPATPALKPAALAPATPPAPSPQDWVSATPMPRPRRRELPRVITRRPG